MAVEDPQKDRFACIQEKLLEIGRVLVTDGHIGVRVAYYGQPVKCVRNLFTLLVP